MGRDTLNVTPSSPYEAFYCTPVDFKKLLPIDKKYEQNVIFISIIIYFL